MPSVAELFKEELSPPLEISLFFGDRKEVVYEKLEDREIDAIKNIFGIGIDQLNDISPKIASKIKPQESIAIKCAGIFKDMLPEKKSITFPSETGTIGVAWLFPQAIRYVASPSSTYPAYTSYPANSWDMSLTAGTPAYLFGDGTNYYKASPATAQHSMLLIFKDGILEIGSTPKIQQFRLTAEGVTKYGIYTVAPVTEVPIEPNKTIYQYPTPMGAVPIFYDKGIMWGFMPGATGVSTIKLLGLVFYEHDFAPSLKWVS